MKLKLPLIVSLSVLSLAIFVKVLNFPVVQQLQLKVFDTFQLTSPRVYTPQPVRIIDIDDESLARLGQWPWPRNIVAKLIDRLNESGAASIAFDMVFAEEDRTSPEKILDLWGKKDKLAYLLDELPDYDVMLADSIGNANVVTGFVLTQEAMQRPPLRKAGFSFAGLDPKHYLDAFSGAVLSLPKLEEAAMGNGAFNSSPDADGVLRRIPLVFNAGGRLVPSLSAESLRIAQGASSYIIKSAGASGEEDYGQGTGIVAVKIGQFEIPTGPTGKLWIYYSEFVPDRYIPAWKVLEPDFNTNLVNGKILFLGTSAPGLKDIRATPFNPLTSGVEVHAQAVEQILSGEYLSRPDWITGAEISLMVVVGLLLIIVMSRLSALWGVLFTFCALVIAIQLSWLVFFKYRILIDPVTPSIAILLLYFSESFSRYITTEKEKRQVRDAFSHYMSPALVAELAAHPERLKLGGETKNLTFLFCDIRGFTSISENLEAQELTLFINQFLTPMTTVILEHKGTIDKYMGDCIMAFWNAPLDDDEHEKNACVAALHMLDALTVFNNKMRLEAEATGRHYIPVNIGIGLNSGSCCVGNMGSDQRFDYSVVGDDVNLASRLEGQSKSYGVTVVVGENTQKKTRELAHLELDFIRVKGKNEPVRIFALLGDEMLALSEAFGRLRGDFTAMLSAYRSQQWEEALALLKQAENSSKVLESLNLEVLFALYRERIAAYRVSPPEVGWDGAFTATSK